MLTRIALVLCLAAVTSAAVIPDGFKVPNCSGVMCTREYNPVCGSDGLTYPSECVLCLRNKEGLVSTLISRTGEC